MRATLCLYLYKINNIEVSLCNVKITGFYLVNMKVYKVLVIQTHFEIELVENVNIMATFTVL